MSSDDCVPFEDVIAAYSEFLRGSERGFQAPKAFLSIWVPSEDAAGSIVNMVIAALDWGENDVSIRLGPATLAAVELANVLQQAARYGAVSTERSGADLVVRVGGLRAPSADGIDLYSNYVAKVTAAAADAAHGDRPSSKATKQGQILIRAIERDVELTLIVARDSHTIVEAGFCGARSVVDRGILESFCRIVEGTPIQDAAEYGAVRLEASLREDNDRRPVAGIVIPRNADNAFALPEALIRSAYSDYSKQTGHRGGTNFFDDPTRASWLNRSDVEKIATIQKGVDAFLADVGDGSYGYRIFQSSDHIRFVGQFNDAVPAAERGTLLMKMERRLRAEIGVKIELYLATVQDLNLIRKPGARTGGKTSG